MQINSAKDLDVYKLAFLLASEIFHTSKQFPKSETYALTDQIRRSSRSVCANLREAWAKRRYPAHFISKLTDADGEINETDTWLDFALKAKYISFDQHTDLSSKCRQIGSMLGKMINNPDPFIRKR